ICLEPRELYIKVTQAKEEFFTRRNLNNLDRLLKGKLVDDFPHRGAHWPWKKRDNDEALLAGIDFIERKFDYNRPVDMTSWAGGRGAIGAARGGGAVRGGARVRPRKRTPPGAGVPPEDESGRSIAVLGGGIGAVTGQWLSALLFRRRRREAAAPAPAG